LFVSSKIYRNNELGFHHSNCKLDAEARPSLKSTKTLGFSTFRQFAVEAFLQRVDRMQPVVSFVHPHYLVFETTEN